jgi:hypothetical protein
MASLLGLMSGMLAFLPNIGAPISGLLMVLVGFSGGPRWGSTASRSMSWCRDRRQHHRAHGGQETADLAPALVLGMQLVMGALFGIIGLALADPMLAMIKVLLEKLAARGKNGQDQQGGRTGLTTGTGPLARKFLYATAFMVLVIAGLFGMRYWAQELSQFAFVPPIPFTAPPRHARHLAQPGAMDRHG